MRYESKHALIADIRKEHQSLCSRLDAIPMSRHREHGVWGDGWTVTDLVAHLAEWQFMFLAWYDAGRTGVTPAMPAPRYKWNQTPQLNRAIWLKHRARSPAAVRANFDSGHARIVDIVEDLSAEQLLMPGYFHWTGTHSLTTYLAPNTASHYRFANRVIDRWQAGGTRVAPPDARPQRRTARDRVAGKARRGSSGVR